MVCVNWPAVGFTILPNVGGIAGGFITRPAIDKWYNNLKKPEWRPPNWAFGPVWTSLYTGMGYASYLVIRDGGGLQGPARLPLAIYGANLAANWTWTPIFFGAKKIPLSLAVMGVVDVTALGMAITFHKINPTAGYLIIPYLLWLSLATALNYCIWRDNKDFDPNKITEIKDKSL